MSDSVIQKLTSSFMRFPGIGPRQAKRFVYYLLHAPSAISEQLIKQIEELKQSVTRCTECGRFYSSQFNHQKVLICEICSDEHRDATLLMLVEKDIDLENIYKSGVYRGYFFVLGGLVKILDKEPVNSIRGQELLKIVENRAKNDNLKEIVIALSANQEGDATTEFLKQYLSPLLQKYQLKISTLGRGLSTGVELEYSDSETLKNALKHRE